MVGLRERESACVRGPREKKKNLEAPKDAKCPRRRCNLVSAVALFEGLSWLPRSVSTCGRKNAPDRRPRPRFPSVLARRSTPWRSVKQALPRALSVLSLGWVRARCSPPFWLSSLPCAFCPANSIPPPQHRRPNDHPFHNVLE